MAEAFMSTQDLGGPVRGVPPKAETTSADLDLRWHKAWMDYRSAESAGVLRAMQRVVDVCALYPAIDPERSLEQWAAEERQRKQYEQRIEALRNGGASRSIGRGHTPHS
jgi:hypothetical protein